MTENPHPFSSEVLSLPEWVRSKTLPEVVTVLARRDAKLLGKAYSRTILRIEKETGALKRCKDLGMMDDIYFGFDGIVGKTPVFWNDAQALGDGQYNLLEDKISTPHSPPTRSEVLIELGVMGRFPFTIDMLAHELGHKHQLPQEQLKRLGVLVMLLSGVAAKYFPGEELIEVMAYRITTLEPHEALPEDLAGHLMNSQSRGGGQAYRGFEEEKIKSAIGAVDNLLALGINTLELCKLAYEKGSWDPDSKTYPQLNKAMIRLMLAGGHKINDLPRLRSEYVRERVEDTRLSRNIATNEILSAVFSLRWG